MPDPMIALTTVQRLLVVSALGWAIFPTWGAAAFIASWVLLAVGSRQRARAARAVLVAHPDAIGSLRDDSKVLLEQNALAYVWPKVAEKWGTTWQMAGLLCILLGGTFLVWAALTLTLWYLAYLVPLVAGLVVGTAVGHRIKIYERVREDLTEAKGAHDPIAIMVNLKTATGKWPPQPPPEGD